MALTGALGALTALVIIPLKARLRPDKTARELKLEGDVKRLELALDHWRDAYGALERETDRLRQQASARQAQQNMPYAQGLQQAQQALQTLQNMAFAQQAHYLAAQQFDGFCNCVPSRAQVFGPGHGLVNRLNQGE